MLFTLRYSEYTTGILHIILHIISTIESLNLRQCNSLTLCNKVCNKFTFFIKGNLPIMCDKFYDLLLFSHTSRFFKQKVTYLKVSSVVPKSSMLHILFFVKQKCLSLFNLILKKFCYFKYFKNLRKLTYTFRIEKILFDMDYGVQCTLYIQLKLLVALLDKIKKKILLTFLRNSNLEFVEQKKHFFF